MSIDLDGDWRELESVPLPVQRAAEAVVPLGDLVIVAQQPQPVVGVGGALAAVAPLHRFLFVWFSLS